MAERIAAIDEGIDRFDPEMTSQVTIAPTAIEAPGGITSVTVTLL